MTTKKNKGGRPVKMTEEKIKQLKAICRLKPTLHDAAAFLDVNTSTIEKWIKRTHGISYSEFRDQHMVHSRFMITRNLLKLCEQNNLGALIYCSKNMNGWSDRPEDDIASEISVTVNKHYHNED